jgi:hypothetical protein
VEGGGGGLTVSGVSRNSGGFVKCVAIQKRLGIPGLVVSVLATGPKVRGFKPGRGRWILRVIKSVACLPSEGK